MDLAMDLAMGLSMDLAMDLTIDLAMDQAIDLAMDQAMDLAINGQTPSKCKEQEKFAVRLHRVFKFMEQFSFSCFSDLAPSCNRWIEPNFCVGNTKGFFRKFMTYSAAFMFIVLCPENDLSLAHINNSSDSQAEHHN